ncbi:hypothetical protein OVN18_09490 [Microcella daejeonensis]|uniref:Uncharacterized protein n=1 Tax=Microcella daejeonensis TaxID=2994971 RepID=A0A9E8S831_9MICO|nr:hypothetical protein [Microcella daejeonensis]WAB80798.1 hypothetical protein OVN18_09490 [Microcella daejeonensis]
MINNILSGVPAGSKVKVSHLQAAPRVQRRVEGAEASEALIAEARTLRTFTGMPFWHALFLAGEQAESGVPDDILRSAMYHQDPADGDVTTLEVGPHTPDDLIALAEKVEGRDVLALTSRVELPTGEERFIPMLDFTSKSDLRGSASTVASAARVLGAPGFLAASGRSFHFYGSQLMERAEQTNFWARALLLTPIVDERWIAHQLRQGEGALRISPNERGQVPRFTARVP